MLRNKKYKKANSILNLNVKKEIIEKSVQRLILFLESIGHKRNHVIQEIYECLLDQGANSKFHIRAHVAVEISRLSDSELLRYLMYRYSYDVHPLDKVITEFPPLVQIEPTSICNYRCIFCYQIDGRLTDKRNGHMGVMSFSLFKTVVDQLVGNVEAVTLASRGEPTINKKLPEMLNYLSGKFLATKVNTNAYLLDDRICHSILDSGIQTLVFSVDSASEPLYSKLRVNGNLQRVLQNIERFNEIKEKCYPRSRLITRVSGVQFDKAQDIEQMQLFWEHLVDQVMFVDYNPWENVYDADKNNIDVPCSDLWRRMFIWWDGKVSPCDVDYLTTLISESVLIKTIPEIWQGEMYTELRKSHFTGDRQSREPCSRCVVI